MSVFKTEDIMDY